MPFAILANSRLPFSFRRAKLYAEHKGGKPLPETDEVAFAEMVEDISALARKLAEKEPYKSASGPEALLVLAAHLDEMIGGDRADQTHAVSVTVRRKRAR